MTQVDSVWKVTHVNFHLEHLLTWLLFIYSACKHVEDIDFGLIHANFSEHVTFKCVWNEPDKADKGDRLVVIY